MGRLSKAVILGIEYQALGLVRQLSREGISCVLADKDAWGVARFSCFTRECFVSPAYFSSEFWPWLSKLASREQCQGAVLIPTDDEQVRMLAEHYDEVTKVYRYTGLPWGSYQRVYDKRLAYALALEVGLATPKTYVPSSTAPLPPEGELGSPFVVKPAFKRAFSQVCKRKAVGVNTNSELQQLLSGWLSEVPVEELVYQELIPGNGENQWSYCGFFVEGKPVAAFTAMRRRQKPPDFGRSSTFVISQHNAEVESESLRLLARLKYTGLAEVEWKRHEHTGKLLFLELNARCWGWHSLASQVVGNLPLMLYRYLTDGVVKPVEPRYGAKWVKWVTDVPVSLHLMSRGQLPLREYFRSFRGNCVSCDWDIADPVPFLAQLTLIPYLIFKRGY